MTKADLVELVAAQVCLTKKDTEIVVDTILEGIARALASEDDGKVELRGFGSFRTRQRRARQGRNPQSGDPVHVPPKRIPFFKPGKDLRRLIDS
ncbi:HU family DNA-binding protein [Candidatus Methylomirabilis sp.]|uniref:Integration host factor subunit beta n=1 Tax=Candidatus Methylomirabilis tolerans TaxID=3123416 RepID=A0AAJ1EI89_9BACT|nr:integration host factor subunit beta [Candidatus Methylomirabilis sp.]